MMIYSTELNTETRELLAVMDDADRAKVLSIAETLMLEFETHHPRARMGCNSAIELVCSVVVFVNTTKGEPQ